MNVVMTSVRLFHMPQTKIGYLYIFVTWIIIIRYWIPCVNSRLIYDGISIITFWHRLLIKTLKQKGVFGHCILRTSIFDVRYSNNAPTISARHRIKSIISVRSRANIGKNAPLPWPFIRIEASIIPKWSTEKLKIQKQINKLMWSSDVSAFKNAVYYVAHINIQWKQQPIACVLLIQEEKKKSESERDTKWRTIHSFGDGKWSPHARAFIKTNTNNIKWVQTSFLYKPFHFRGARDHLWNCWARWKQNAHTADGINGHCNHIYKEAKTSCARASWNIKRVLEIVVKWLLRID